MFGKDCDSLWSASGLVYCLKLSCLIPKKKSMYDLNFGEEERDFVRRCSEGQNVSMFACLNLCYLGLSDLSHTEQEQIL